jgi:hypothetical protein
MARTFHFCPVGKAIPATATTLVWTPNEIDASGLVALHFGIEEADAATVVCGWNNRLDASGGRIRVKAGSRTVVDMTIQQLLAYQERFAVNRAPDSLAAVAETDVTGRVFTLPLNGIDASNDDAADAVQFMPGTTIQVELDLVGVAASTGTAWLAYTRTTQPARFFKELIAQPMNLAASTRNYRVPIAAAGIVQSIAWPVASIGEIRARLAGIDVAHLVGRGYPGMSQTNRRAPDMIQAVQQLYDGTGGTTWQWIKFGQGLPANPANSYAEITASAAATATDEMVVESLVPVGDDDDGG